MPAAPSRQAVLESVAFGSLSALESLLGRAESRNDDFAFDAFVAGLNTPDQLKLSEGLKMGVQAATGAWSEVHEGEAVSHRAVSGVGCTVLCCAVWPQSTMRR